MNLTMVSRIAEQTDDGFLLYRIDMAIVQASAKARVVADADVSSSLS